MALVDATNCVKTTDVVGAPMTKPAPAAKATPPNAEKLGAALDDAAGAAADARDAAAAKLDAAATKDAPGRNQIAKNQKTDEGEKASYCRDSRLS
jgi:hypothetical protein